MNRSFLAALSLLLALVPAGRAAAQRPSPLVYDDPEWQWLDNRDPDAPRPSPNALVGLQIGSTRVMVAYGSPGVKGRKIFGGLVPFGTLWRTGANEATTISLAGDLTVQDQVLTAGTYSLFTIPRPDEWTVIFNRKNNQWGAYEYQPDHDALRLAVPVEPAEYRENFTVEFDAIVPDGSGADLVLRWERSRIALRLKEAE